MVTENQYKNLQYVRTYLQPLMNQLEGMDYYFYGGCLRDLYMGRTPHDFDIGCSSREGVDGLVAKLKDIGYSIEIITDFGYKMRYLNNMVDISNWQLPTIAEKISNFDFTVNALGFTSDYKMIFHSTTFDDIDERILKEIKKDIDGEPHRPDIGGRTVKFWERGFSFKDGEYKQTIDLELYSMDVTLEDWNGEEFDIRSNTK